MGLYPKYRTEEEDGCSWNLIGKFCELLEKHSQPEWPISRDAGSDAMWATQQDTKEYLNQRGT